MSLDFRHRRNRFTGNPTMRHGRAWILCGLLLLLCANAKLARYGIHQRTTRLATTQAYLDGGESFQRLAAGAAFLLCCAGLFAVAAPSRAEAILIAVVVPDSTPFRGFDPKSHLRPPPVR
jgi:hypothetical protein